MNTRYNKTAGLYLVTVPVVRIEDLRLNRHGRIAMPGEAVRWVRRTKSTGEHLVAVGATAAIAEAQARAKLAQMGRKDG